LSALFDTRYHERSRPKESFRDAYGLKDEGVPYAGVTAPENPTSGAYGGASLAWFPCADGALMTLVVGTKGLAPDEGLLTRHGHRRRISALRSYLAQHNVAAWSKADPAAISTNVPDAVRHQFERCDAIFDRYGEVIYSAAWMVTPRFESTIRGPVLTLLPGGKVGAIPLRSGTTGHVRAGYVVRPRFGWDDVGSILKGTGWHSAPDILHLPLVPGSGREVPPWVLAGPVIARLRALLDQLKRGFDFVEDIPAAPRGTVRWSRYLRTSLPAGRWHKVPCRFPDLTTDPVLRGAIRWTLERVIEELAIVAPDDRVAIDLRAVGTRLLERLGDVPRVYPRAELIGRISRGDPLLEQTVRSGLEAIGWVRDERGLGGGRQMDGLAWALSLDQLWEDHVAAKVRQVVRQEGGVLQLGRRGETVTPLHWSDASYRSLGHLVPDIVVKRASSVWIVDAKYKSHLAEINEEGWRQMADQIRESHRADIHQVLAYSALFDAREITATLAYPLRRGTWDGLRARGLDRSTADVYSGGRHVRLELWGLPFSGGLESRRRVGFGS
jgi:hypothetical protein